MNFTEVRYDGEILGFRHENDSCLFFFGTRNCQVGGLHEVFPNCHFSFLRQVHGREVVKVSSADRHPFTADGQFTAEKKLGLVIQTADCAPVLLGSTTAVCALHCGWRSVAQDIIAAARTAFARESPRWLAIGPHILTFEIGLDVLAQLQAGAPDNDRFDSPHPDHQKVYFDLARLVKAQLSDTFSVPTEAVQTLARDTIRDPLFHSFRRDRDKAGRNLSFVMLKP